MFTKEIVKELKLELATKYIAKDIFEIIDRNRDNLKQYFNWLDSVKGVLKRVRRDKWHSYRCKYIFYVKERV